MIKKHSWTLLEHSTRMNHCNHTYIDKLSAVSINIHWLVTQVLDLSTSLTALTQGLSLGLNEYSKSEKEGSATLSTVQCLHHEPGLGWFQVITKILSEELAPQSWGGLSSDEIVIRPNLFISLCKGKKENLTNNGWWSKERSLWPVNQKRNWYCPVNLMRSTLVHTKKFYALVFISSEHFFKSFFWDVLESVSSVLADVIQ